MQDEPIRQAPPRPTPGEGKLPTPPSDGGNRANQPAGPPKPGRRHVPSPPAQEEEEAYEDPYATRYPAKQQPVEEETYEDPDAVRKPALAPNQPQRGGGRQFWRPPASAPAPGGKRSPREPPPPRVPPRTGGHGPPPVPQELSEIYEEVDEEIPPAPPPSRQQRPRAPMPSPQQNLQQKKVYEDVSEDPAPQVRSPVKPRTPVSIPTPTKPTPPRHTAPSVPSHTRNQVFPPKPKAPVVEIKLFCNHPVLKKKMEHKLEIHKDKTLNDATDMAIQIFELEKVVERDNCRIVKYDEYQDTLECSFDEEEATALEKLLGGVKQSYSFDLLLETKKPDQKFQQYKPGGVTVRVYVTDIEKDLIVEPPSSVRAYLTQTVAEFKELVEQVLNLPNKIQRCVLERFHNDLKVLETPEKTLKSEGFFKTNKVYLEVNALEEETLVRFWQSKFFCLLERHQNTIRVNVTLPSLPDVEEYKKSMFLREPSPTGRDSAVESDISDALKSDKGVFIPETDNWDEPCSSVDKSSTSVVDKASLAGQDSSDDSSLSPYTDISKRYFHAEVEENEDTHQRSLLAYVDKRINLGAFKSELEPFVGVPAGNFTVYRVYTNNQEFESIRLNETLSFPEDGRINIKLGRALKSGEYRVKVFQLLVNDQEPSKFLIDTIFARGMTVAESKQQILPELKQQLGMDVPLDRCRLRKKTWKNPVTIYGDNQVYEDEIPIYPNWEVFLEVLEGPEVISTAQLAIFVRRWWPSKYELGPIEEVVINDQTVDMLKHTISSLSKMNVDDIEIAKGRGTFPYDMSLLQIHGDLDWNPAVMLLDMWPLYICDDGCLVY